MMRFPQIPQINADKISAKIRVICGKLLRAIHGSVSQIQNKKIHIKTENRN